MEYSPQDITTATFAIVKKGYDPAEVRSYLNGVSKALETSQQQATAMEARARAAVAKLQELTQAEAAPAPAPAAPSAETGSDESEAIGRTLLLAQRTADGLIAEARAEADTMVNAARAEASAMVADAQRQAETAVEDARAEGRKALESERAKAESDVQALLARRDFLLADVEQLEAFVTTHRSRLLEVADSLRDTAASGLGDLRRPLLSAAADAPVARPGGDSANAVDTSATEDAADPAPEAGATSDGADASDAEVEGDTRVDDDRPTEAIPVLASLVDETDQADRRDDDPEPTPIGNPSLLDFDA